MRRFVGLAVVAIGLAHVLYVVVAKSSPLAAIVRDGVVNAVESHPEREAASWSLWFGVFVATTGALVATLQARGQPVPAVSGWSLLAMGLVGGVLLPVSGFWAGIPLGLLILLPAPQRDRAPRSQGRFVSHETRRIRHLSVCPSQRLHISRLPWRQWTKTIEETARAECPKERQGS